MDAAVLNPEQPVPKVSVVMPVKNGEQSIDEAITSILTQTVKELELIIVVNGSTDRTYEIACQRAIEDPRIRIVQLKNGHIPLALNTGIAHARASWVARMDADDVSLPTRFERQLDTLARNPDIAALGTWGWRIAVDGRRISSFQIGPTTREEFFRARETGLIYLLSSSVIFSREVALNLGGFREDYPVTQDIEFWSRIADNHVVMAIPEPLVCYRIHGNAISTQKLATQLTYARRAELNMHRRRLGLAELTHEEFLKVERERPPLQRLKMQMEARSQYCYRHAGGLLAARHPLGIAWLLGSFALYPPLPVDRIRKQRVLSTLFSRTKDPVRSGAIRSAIDDTASNGITQPVTDHPKECHP